MQHTESTEDSESVPALERVTTEDEEIEANHTNVRTLQLEITDEQIRVWKDDAASFTRNTLFDVKQFVEDRDLKFGEVIQKAVCKHLHIDNDENKAFVFWEDKEGVEAVRTAFRRKRQAALTAVKAGFRGNLKQECSPGKQVLHQTNCFALLYV